jgi:isoleucyl-tRNA synthetase
MKGRDLLGTRYRPPFPYFEGDEGTEAAWRVVPADFVTTEDGTGIVHMAPAFGADDFAVGRREGLPLFNPVAPDGTFTEKVPLVAGQWFKDADRALARDLRERGLLFRHETYLHNYPHDWRKGTPLMSYPVESWFIRTTAIRDRMVELNRTINWQPEGIGEGRFGQWLENNVDWAISRMRFWGTPLPIWVNDRDPEDVVVVGSVEELRQRAGGTSRQRPSTPRPASSTSTALRGRRHLPRPDGGTYRRVPDLLDVWFDSGAMPFAQWHYPFENEDVFQRNFPADFIAEGVDQTRGWFYTLHAIGALVEDSVAYKNVVVNGLVLDADGEKMSKSKGNTVRRNRRRFWKEGKSLDKTAAYQTLYECLVNLAKIASPVAPFISEWIYRNLNTVTGFEEESVHLAFYPAVEETAIDRELEYRMDMARTISSIVLRIRNQINVNVRQPLSKLIVPANSEEQRKAIDSVKDIILDEVNVKQIIYVDDDSGIVQKSAKPNYPVLGRKLGKRMKAVASAVQELDTEQISEFESNGSIQLDLPDGDPVTLGVEDLTIARHGLEGWSVETESGVTVALDTELDEDLIREGLAREIVNRIQNMRKEANYELTDRIDIFLEGDEEITSAVEFMKEYLKRETLAESIKFGSAGDYDFIKQWEIDDKSCTIAIQRNTNY